MITYYTESDLLKFGNELLSKKGDNSEFEQMVSDADIANFRAASEE